MRTQFVKSMILFLLLASVFGVSLCPQVALGDDARPFCLLEEVADFDEVEDFSELEVVGTLERFVEFCRFDRFQPIVGEVRRQIDWLLVHERAARAPPLG